MATEPPDIATLARTIAGECEARDDCTRKFEGTLPRRQWCPSCLRTAAGITALTEAFAARDRELIETQAERNARARDVMHLEADLQEARALAWEGWRRKAEVYDSLLGYRDNLVDAGNDIERLESTLATVQAERDGLQLENTALKRELPRSDGMRVEIAGKCFNCGCEQMQRATAEGPTIQAMLVAATSDLNATLTQRTAERDELREQFAGYKQWAKSVMNNYGTVSADQTGINGDYLARAHRAEADRDRLAAEVAELSRAVERIRGRLADTASRPESKERGSAWSFAIALLAGLP